MSSGSEKWIDYARYSLYFGGVCNIFLTFLVALAVAMGQFEGDLRMAAGEAIIIVIILFLCAGFGGLGFIIANGLKARKKWAWTGGVILGVLYLGSACFPFGAIVLYALFQNQEAFADNSEGK